MNYENYCGEFLLFFLKFYGIIGVFLRRGINEYKIENREEKSCCRINKNSI